MQCSLYGKLPAKRDFVAVGAARGFLDAWEPWLQGAVSSSRAQLRENWQPAFLTAPIWRFWLGADICGRTVMGALMSSLDGVGRYFPLTLFACADDNAAIPPPELRSQDDWFDVAEALLMSTLDHDAEFDRIVAALGALAPPFQQSSNCAGQDIIRHDDGTVAVPTRGRDFSTVFSSIRTGDHARIYAGSTFWWTLGGEGFAPVALSGKRMPNPFLFSAMLTGDFVQVPV